MTYEIYQLLGTNAQILDVFAIYNTIIDRVVYVGDRKNTQQYIDEHYLIGFDLDNPTELMDYRSYNKLCI